MAILNGLNEIFHEKKENSNYKTSLKQGHKNLLMESKLKFKCIKYSNKMKLFVRILKLKDLLEEFNQKD